MKDDHGPNVKATATQRVAFPWEELSNDSDQNPEDIPSAERKQNPSENAVSNMTPWEMHSRPMSANPWESGLMIMLTCCKRQS